MSLSTSYIALKTICVKETTRILRIWIQTLVPPVITMILYFVIFGHLIGERIGEMRGFTYINFIVPGLIMMSIIMNSYANVVSSFFGAKFQKNIEEILVAPVPISFIIIGYITGGVIRGCLVGGMIFIVSLLFTELQVFNVLVLISISLLASILFSLAGFTNAIFAKRFDHISIVPAFILTPLTYLGGVFYSIDLLDSPWKEISFLNPILYLVNAFRYSLIGVSDVSLVASFVIISAFIVILYCINYWLVRIGYGLRS